MTTAAVAFGLSGIAITLLMLLYTYRILSRLPVTGDLSLAMVFPHWRGLVGLKVLVVTFLVFALGTGIAGLGLFSPSPARDWVARGCSAVALLGILYFLRNISIALEEA